MTFIGDAAKRLAIRVRLTTDEHRPHFNAVDGAFGCDVDYAKFVEIYGAAPGPAGR